MIDEYIGVTLGVCPLWHNHHNRIQHHEGHLLLNRQMTFFAAIIAANRNKYAR